MIDPWLPANETDLIINNTSQVVGHLQVTVVGMDILLVCAVITAIMVSILTVLHVWEFIDGAELP